MLTHANICVGPIHPREGWRKYVIRSSKAATHRIRHTRHGIRQRMLAVARRWRAAASSKTPHTPHKTPHTSMYASIRQRMEAGGQQQAATRVHTHTHTHTHLEDELGLGRNDGRKSLLAVRVVIRALQRSSLS
jgi:hypothetical protein